MKLHESERLNSTLRDYNKENNERKREREKVFQKLMNTKQNLRYEFSSSCNDRRSLAYFGMTFNYFYLIIECGLYAFQYRRIVMCAHYESVWECLSYIENNDDNMDMMSSD